MTSAEKREKTISIGEWTRLQETLGVLEDKRQRQTEWATREIGAIQARLTDMEKRIATLETECVRYSKPDGGYHRHLVRGQSETFAGLYEGLYRQKPLPSLSKQADILQQAEEEMAEHRNVAVSTEYDLQKLKAMVQSWADEVETVSSATELCDLAERMRRCS